MVDEKALRAAFAVNHHPESEPSETELAKLRAAITAYLQALSPGSTGETEGWRDIKGDPPPMDGRMAIVYRPLARLTQDEPVALKRLLRGHQGCWEATVPPGDEPYNPTDGSCHVTHWRPLPAPPSAILSAVGERE